MTLIDRIKKHEGYRRYAYHCPAGRLTIGYGTMIEQGGFGVPEYVAEELIVACLKEIRQMLAKHGWYRKLNEPRREVIQEMSYQLGVHGVLKFKKMIQAIIDDDYKLASEEMLDSLWHKQTPERAQELAGVMRQNA